MKIKSGAGNMPEAKPKLKLKFTSRIVNKMEVVKGVSIENLLGDLSLANLAFFIEYANYDEVNDKIGVNENQAFEILDELLPVYDKEELLMQIMEYLQKAGFLSRKININQMREKINREVDKALITEDSANSGEN